MTIQAETQTTTLTLVQELDELHDSYARAINLAIENDDLALAHRLASDYDEDAVQLVAEREGKTHLLPMLRDRMARRSRPDNRLRRVVAKLTRKADDHTLWAFNAAS